jgi:hypothetical protein
VKFRPLLTTAIVCFSLGPTAVAYSQNNEFLRDVPFTATRRYVEPNGAERIQKIARRSDGSTYLLDFNKGVPFYLQIRDIPNRRDVLLVLTHGQYVITLGSAGENPTSSLNEFLARSRGPHSISVGQTDLQPKVESGMTLYGNTMESPLGTQERWEAAELGTTYSITTNFKDGTQRKMTLVDIQRGEPDQRLFEIPKEFKPANVGDPQNAQNGLVH